MQHNRHGRGIRGPLAWPAVPAMRPRAAFFDELVIDALERIEARLGKPLGDLRDIELAVEDVPPSDPAPWETQIALARTFPAIHGQPARIVLYRRPIESRTSREEELADLIDEVVTEQVAELIGVPPEDLGRA